MRCGSACTALAVLAAVLVVLPCSGCSEETVRRVDVLALRVEPTPEEAASRGFENWHRMWGYRGTRVWAQAWNTEEPCADLKRVLETCRAFLQSMGHDPASWHLDFYTHHARLWVLRYMHDAPPPNVVIIGGQVDLWYDSLCDKVVAMTFVD